ncbi:MAG TPA: GNAT family N-acetyltransferase [Thermoanaerobaculia bacterium]
MRGLRLFVRPIDSSDYELVSRFIANNLVPGSAVQTVPACGLLGKLLGEIVAYVAFELTPEALRIDDILVATELRRKWIGRAMFRELETLAGQLERRRVVVEDARGAGEFFRRIGFQSEGERWVREW